jgi:hypothetical protein
MSSPNGFIQNSKKATAGPSTSHGAKNAPYFAQDDIIVGVLSFGALRMASSLKCYPFELDQKRD